MEQDENLNQLISLLALDKVELSSAQQEKLYLYHLALVQYAQKHRIISKNDIHHIVKKHFLSSFWFVKEIKKVLKEGDQILDLGSGAGFPGVILAICFENNHVTMIDSVRKKTLFLKRVLEDMGCKNTMVVNERIEDYIDEHSPNAEIITARALASIDNLVELTKPILQSAVLHTIKGKDYSFEILQSEGEISVSVFDIERRWIEFSEYLNNKVYLTISSV